MTSIKYVWNIDGWSTCNTHIQNTYKNMVRPASYNELVLNRTLPHLLLVFLLLGVFLDRVRDHNECGQHCRQRWYDYHRIFNKFNLLSIQVLWILGVGIRVADDEYHNTRREFI